jgi:predicted RNA binding protein YcfA (HicA-like mRNA interferase family)
MSSQFPPLECGEVKRILKNLGFKFDSQNGSHEHYVRTSRNHGLIKVTVDCPKAPFTQKLIGYMRSQAKLSKREFYKALDKKQAIKIVQNNYE